MTLSLTKESILVSASKFPELPKLAAENASSSNPKKSKVREDAGSDTVHQHIQHQHHSNTEEEDITVLLRHSHRANKTHLDPVAHRIRAHY
jgi:hypothetical protein